MRTAASQVEVSRLRFASLSRLDITCCEKAHPYVGVAAALPDKLVSTVSPSLLEAYLAQRANLIRFFALRLNSQAAAEDLVQDIYFRLDRVDVEAINDVDAYLYKVGWNMMLDHLRQQRRTSNRDRAWSETEFVTRAGVTVDSAPSAEAAVASRERLVRLEQRLAKLPLQTQRAFRLHKFEGLSHAETAARLGVSKSAIEKHISAALKKLAEDNP